MKSNVNYQKVDTFINAEQGIVVVKIKCQIMFNNLPDVIKDLCYSDNIVGSKLYDIIQNKFNFIAVGKSKVAPSDKFDEQTGKYIALTRAQAKAQHIACNVYADIADVIFNDILMPINTLGGNCVRNYAKEETHIKELINK